MDSKEIAAIAYEVARMVFEGSLGRTEGRDQIVMQTGINEGTAGSYITVFLAMMSGEKYTRTLNKCSTRYFLERIREDYGESTLKKAMDACRKHAEYYASLGYGRLAYVERIVEEYLKQQEAYSLPGEVESFQLMRSILEKALAEYTKEHESECISNFFVAIQDYLEAFSKGIEPEKQFNFDFVWKNRTDDHHEIEYMNFYYESEMIQVISGGSIYNKSVGSDSYTNWDYSIELNGWDGDNCYYWFSTLLELVRNGAKLSIESPDEYVYNER